MLLLGVAAFTWQNGFSVAALVVAGISLVYATRADRRAGRAEERANRSEGREARREEREEAEASDRRRGHPRVVRESGRDQPADGPHAGQVVYEYEVHNDGHAVITELQLWIADAEENVVSTGGGGPLTTKPGDTIFVGGIGLTNQHATGLRLLVKWADLEGEHGPEWTGLRPTVV